MKRRKLHKVNLGSSKEAHARGMQNHLAVFRQDVCDVDVLVTW